MSDQSSIRLEMQEGLAIVSLAQPARGNPFDGNFTSDFKRIFGQLWDRQDLRAVLLRADGGNFSVGGDLKSLHPNLDRLPTLIREWTADLHMGLQRAWHLPVPVVAAVQGFAMGGGLALVAGCDVVIAGESTRFGAAFSNIGFSCDSGSSVTLTARMGVARARRFMLLGELLSSAEAKSAGLADEVVPDDQLQQRALELAQRLANGPTLALGQIKRLFLKAGSAHLEAQLEDEALTLARLSASVDAREGITAMVEKRKAQFQGR
jgi:2-(1,2-epoxy-1,2-dihydrophenyl)acetyl-CoA isomerase